MNKNEEDFEKLRDFRMEKMIEIKNSENGENIDIEDVIYCGQMDFEIDGELKKKDVYLMKKNVDGSIKWEYYADGDMIAIDYNEMIIPTADYQKVDFKPLIKNEDKQVSLNELETEKMSHMAKALGIKEKQIDACAEIDNSKLTEKNLLRSLNIKSEFNPNNKINGSESFDNLIPGTSKFSKIAVVYSNNSNDRFKMVGITNDGKVEEIPALTQTEGVNPAEKIVSADRYGENIKEQSAQAMFKINGRANEGFSINIGSMGCVEVNYIRRSTDDEYLSIPVEATHTRYVKSEMKRQMDKTKNTRVEEEIDKSQSEIEKHGNANWINIDDDPNNDINHDDVIRIKDGTEEISFEEEAKKAKVSVEEFKRIYEEQSESLTPEQRIENVHEEIEEQYMGNDERRK